jgi:hypothetical protein
MTKGQGGSGKKSSHYQFKKRCEYIGCKKRAKNMIGDKYFCKLHS